MVANGANAEPARLRTGERALYFSVYPNFIINRYAANDTNLVIPRGPDRTEVIFDFFFSDVTETASPATESIEISSRSSTKTSNLRVRSAGPALSRVHSRPALCPSRSRGAPLSQVALRRFDRRAGHVAATGARRESTEGHRDTESQRKPKDSVSLRLCGP